MSRCASSSALAVAAALLCALVPLPARADDGCTLEGSAVLTRGGKPVSGTIVVAVEKVPASAWKQKPSTHRMLQQERQFVPRVLVVVKGDSVEFTNEDKEEHSVFSNSSTRTFDFPASRRGVSGVTTFMKLGPARIQCDIHSSMRADVLVVANPFHALTDAQGRWRITGVPKGPVTLRYWEPNGGEATRAVTCTEGTVAVGAVPLDEAPAPRLVRKTGEAYREYQ